MTWLSETTKKLVFLDLQNGAAVKTIMEKYRISRPTVGKIRNAYSMDEAEEGEESSHSAESEGSGESLGGESERSEESSGESDAGSEAETHLDAASEAGVREMTYELDKGEYLPSYQTEMVLEDEPLQRVCSPIQEPRRSFPVEHSIQQETRTSRDAAPEYNVTKDQLFIRDKIKAYLNAFPHKVGSICGETDEQRDRWLLGLGSLPVEKLQDILEGLRYKIQQGGVSDFAFTLVCSTTLAIETGAPYVGLNLKGYSDSIRTNAQAREAILEIMCENMSDFVISPEKRLLLILLTTAYNTHRLNQTTVDQHLEKPAPAVETFADL